MLSLVPDATLRTGDFRGRNPIFNPFDIDPASGKRRAFPGNVIPPGIIDPISRKFLDTFEPLPNRGDANIDDFYRLGAIMMAIGLQMACVKCFGDFLQARLINWVRWNGDREFVGLTLVPGINRAL